ncbi:DUF397 domain-containing protein [Streptomyces sp. NPDC005498]|uniref:DUF397 domain-containing protein n=1 Tax=Streptomyces sp. NPDC005498 TaxID=3364717 RepID=UPI0036B561F4
MYIRDSKQADEPILSVGSAGWDEFVRIAARGRRTEDRVLAMRVEPDQASPASVRAPTLRPSYGRPSSSRGARRGGRTPRGGVRCGRG